MEYLKKVPYWGWIGIFIILLFLWQSLSGWATSRKLYNLMLDQLRKDQTQIIKDKDTWIKKCEEEILKLGKEKEQIQKEKDILKKKDIQSAKEIAELKESNDALKKKLREIVISGDPDKLIDDINKHLNKEGLGSIRRRSRSY